MRFLKYFGALVIASVLIVGLLVGVRITRIKLAESPLVAGWQGARQAREDLSHGIYKQLLLGMPGPSIVEYQRAMETRYNVHVKLLGCVTFEGTDAYVHAYNNVSAESINRRYGHDIFTETSHQVQVDWDRTHEEVQAAR